MLQQTAAAILVPRDITALSAAAAAELCRYAALLERCAMTKRLPTEYLAYCESTLCRFAFAYVEDSRRNDAESIKPNAFQVNNYLGHLLASNLLFSDSWNCEERWIDGLSQSRFAVDGNTIEVQGQMIWGLTADIGGDQWAEPFYARLICRESEMSYLLLFGNSVELAEKQVRFGLYPVVSNLSGGKLQGRIPTELDSTKLPERSDVGTTTGKDNKLCHRFEGTVRMTS